MPSPTPAAQQPPSPTSSRSESAHIPVPDDRTICTAVVVDTAATMNPRTAWPRHVRLARDRARARVAVAGCA
eukprot:COSAG06_NODE_17_length_34906_cov_31.908268_36_plen_72_part_00